ncbi:apolipoprotein N-acyltransferase [Pseudactinotalea sp. HY158]|uniref:apolipoprotein N-acyltransferase n=1 Tax=Pseudactinotalea sp. HY158 TaxID=2654547 RepID=UPI00129CCCC0|nr:apolipoprotein N-acyltransferase [Pseudactinotalea sp. HY158]QGH69400.1 apolipoprotein N-acyltransferase [Pseudactinotalea sp. HY158]
MHTPRRLTTLVSAALAGVLTDAAFPQRNLWPLALVGMAMLFLALRRDSARWAVLVGFTWGVGFFLPHLWWAREAVGPVPWIALSVAESLIMAAGCACYVWIRRMPGLRRGGLLAAIAFAAAWTSAEQVRQVWPFGGFPWGRLAFSQTDGPLLALAGVVGAIGVSFVVALLGGVAGVGWQAVRRFDLVRVPAAVLILALGLGAPLLIGLDTRAEAGTLRVGAVQGNVAEPGLDAFGEALQVTTNHVRGTQRLIAEHGPVDLVVWPENAADRDPRSNRQARALVEEAAASAGVPILVGTVRYTDDARYNEMLIWDPVTGAGDAYAKQIPAAFAEYIPMRSIARKFSAAVDLVQVDMARGTEVANLTVPLADRSVDVGTIICFEVAYDSVARDAALAGAEFLLVPTNNATFGYTSESTQQFAMSRFRAVEHGRAVVQISTVGVSGVIMPDGSVSEQTGLYTAEEFAADLPLRTSITLADRLGDAPVVLLLALTGIGFTLGVVSHRRHR